MKNDGFKFSEDELIGALVAAIALDLAQPIVVECNAATGLRVVGTRRDATTGRAGQQCEHYGDSFDEAAFVALVPFGVFEPLGLDGDPIGSDGKANTCRLRMDVEAVEAHVLSHVPERPIDVEALLAAFVSLAANVDLAITTRAWFTPRPEYARLMRKLAEHGYTGQLGERFLWTDKAGPAMRAAYRWTDENQSLYDDDERIFEQMWTTMPVEAKQRYFLSGFDPLGFAVYMTDCWDKETERWTASKPSPLAGELAGGGIGIATLLYAAYVEPFRG